jgi:hypothetical protein
MGFKIELRLVDESMETMQILVSSASQSADNK